VDDVVWRRHRAPDYFSACGLTRTLVEATARALRGSDCGDLIRTRDWTSRADDELVFPADRVGEVDASVVAEWIVEQYAGRSYPGVVMGSRHGSAALLAAAMGVPWLPAAFDLDVRWSDGGVTDGAAAKDHGASVAARILSASRDVLVRHVHDPVRMADAAGCRVQLSIRWRSLPAPFRRFLDAHVQPGGFVLVIRDVRSWPVLDDGDGYSFQVGSSSTGLDLATYTNGPDLSSLMRRNLSTATWPVGQYRRVGVEHGVEPGVEAGARRWALQRDGRAYSVLHNGPGALSAAVADIYRDWLREHGKTGNRLVITAGRLLDPWHILRAGLVPYWCEAPTRDGVAATELWLAGCRPFSSVDVLPEPPGATWSQVAPMAQWSVLAQFAGRRGAVNPSVARAYPLRAMAPRHATDALRTLPYDLPTLPPLRVETAVAGLRSNAPSNGILVSYGVGD
jgi:hypothetical protein